MDQFITHELIENTIVSCLGRNKSQEFNEFLLTRMSSHVHEDLNSRRRGTKKTASGNISLRLKESKDK